MVATSTVSIEVGNTSNICNVDIVNKVLELVSAVFGWVWVKSSSWYKSCSPRYKEVLETQTIQFEVEIGRWPRSTGLSSEFNTAGSDGSTDADRATTR